MFNVYAVVSDDGTNQKIEYASVSLANADRYKADLEQLEKERQMRHKQCFACFKNYIGLKNRPPFDCYALSQFDTCENEVVAKTKIVYGISVIEVEA